MMLIKQRTVKVSII